MHEEPVVEQGAPGAPMTLKETRGDDYPEFGEDPKRIVSYFRKLYKDGEQEALVRYKRATYNLLFADGRQWIDWNQREKMWRDAPNVDGRVRATMNYILPIQRARIQRLISGELNWDVRPDTISHVARDRAIVARNLIQAHWKISDMDAKLRQSLFLAFNTGLVVLKSFWNPRIGPLTPATVFLQQPQVLGVDETGQPVTQPGPLAEYYIDVEGTPLAPKDGTTEPPPETFYFRPGDVDTAVRTVFNIRINEDAVGWTPAEGLRWIMDAEVVPISVVKEKFGALARNVQAVDGTASMMAYERIVKAISQRSGQAPLGGDIYGAGQTKAQSDKDPTMLLEYWELPSEAIPGGRLTIIAGEELMFDGPLPWGEATFVPVFDERRPLDAWGRPSVNDLVPPQKVINQNWSLIVEEMQRSGVGQWIGFDVPGVPDQLTNEHGAIVKVPFRSFLGARRVSDVISRMPSPQPPRDRWQLIQEAKATMFDIGAWHEISRGSVPPGVDSGIAVQLLQEAEVSQMQDAVQQLKNSLVMWARQRLVIAKWGYGQDEERWIPITRPDLDYWMESINGASLPDPQNISVDLKGFRPQSSAALRAEVKELMQNQIIDPRTGLRLMDLGQGVEGAFESVNRQYARARRENLAIEEGRYIKVPDPMTGAITMIHPEDGMPFHLPQFDDPAIHLDVLNELILDDTKPPEVRQCAMAHAAEHQMVLMQQQMAMAAAQGQPDQGASNAG